MDWSLPQCGPTRLHGFRRERSREADGGRIAEMPDPELRDNDMLVQIHASGVNILDSKIRDGEFKLVGVSAFTATM